MSIFGRIIARARPQFNADIYKVPADGGDVWVDCGGGGYHIQRSLWNRRIAEGRTDWAEHDFLVGGEVVEDGIPSQWRRSEAVCRRCGETRRVFGVSAKELNRDRWCIPT